ncbi:hypothetical protein OUZ56_033180 [Daphnia magna]|uniref:Uncharacterized protein n=1 Tax=Daphnia magna TaxID=35525 RepID=A0ABR0BAF4_9CRUS|nr:hypothetical protein OUZ56_033180 [Daphnia magna]
MKRTRSNVGFCVLVDTEGLPTLFPELHPSGKELGYFDIHTLMQLETPESLQESIIDIYGNCPEYDTFQPEEKKALLGPIHWKNPARFKFLPGEKASLISIKTLCSSLVGKLPLVYISPIIEQATPTFNVKAARQASIHTGQQQQSVNNSTLQRTEAVDNCGKTISTYMDDWCSRKGQLVNYGAEH